MYNLSNLKNKRKYKKRVGRGTGSGHGKTCCRGHKGQTSRSGGTKGRRFEGGQTPLYRRLPKKRGFKNLLFKTEYLPINLEELNKYEKEADFSKFEKPVKILGSGEIKKALKVSAAAFSKSAVTKIEKAGGSIVKC
ncbi:50S ribosomal protein L15 [candidate division WOR-1 bacterium RIFOXYA12_FULL_43_27]|uniref:Large ribosomal subunit protein uL15 n=1 Tax=candidate division WOR-1 bacterium RIFOXYC2_FULL_46_14 TaxID=1802587 RepID=A0A1F4U5M3_UNCSA|nr:MAG: 50S ribosomal protein L15 [candidate division WOR-1 bacterium RIFOXYA12_FULL_43_27]OGC20430.1 MAG: 50S ribosomal protein L15 [candidate division WOR-1 bacterium RIFOXYB2_FULL_46_45]OGC31833.1 MAG: 50S ribosomal protein L15 [candidate division WOR-1 bacterium RIFOXYA2_FULL_46_56]OGC40275.1 MAG: 50S ribosomal protein L15 [candidate division WOR-1 bacterium RIFOXYC2_FULL_46_14]